MTPRQRLEHRLHVLAERIGIRQQRINRYAQVSGHWRHLPTINRLNREIEDLQSKLREAERQLQEASTCKS